MTSNLTELPPDFDDIFTFLPFILIERMFKSITTKNSSIVIYLYFIYKQEMKDKYHVDLKTKNLMASLKTYFFSLVPGL